MNRSLYFNMLIFLDNLESKMNTSQIVDLLVMKFNLDEDEAVKIYEIWEKLNEM